MSIKLIRVCYGKKDTPLKDREYQVNGCGPVGALKEWEEFFTGKILEVIER